MLIALSAAANGPSAADLFEKAAKAEQAGKVSEAYLLYSQAAALAPAKVEYWQRSLALRDKALAETGRASAEQQDLLQLQANNTDFVEKLVAAANPYRLQNLTARDLMEARAPLPPTLEPQPERKSFSLRGDTKTVFNEVAGAWGLECLFDDDYPAGPSIRFEMNDVDYRDALHGLEAATGSFIVPLTPRRFLVVKDTPQKRAQLEPVVSVAVYLPEAMNQQELKDIITGVQQAMAIERAGIDTPASTVVFRDRISKVLAARDMILSLMVPRAEVGFEMQVLEVSRNDAITYGVSLPTEVSLIPLTDWMNNKPTIGATVKGILTFGGGKTLLGLGIMNAFLVAEMTKSSGHVWIHSLMRSIEGQPATFSVGDRYPVISSSYALPSESPGEGFAPIPAFNFEDLGLTLKITPIVHGSTETTLDIDAQFKVLSGSGTAGLPVISNRSLKTKARLKFEEWAVVGGLLNAQEARSVAGIAGLSRVPILGPLTSVRDRSNAANQVLILIRPHLLTPPPSEGRTRVFALGSDIRPITPL